MKIFLCGDVMTGRGIDQILPHPVSPHLYERYVKDAREYITLAEHTNGKIPRAADYSYIWGDALGYLAKENIDARLINLETSVTKSEDYWPGKGINYRMAPENIDCLRAANIDYCTLSNNHILDWGYDGLFETLSSLDNAKILHSGAGRNSFESSDPAIIDRKENGRVIVFAIGEEDSGIPSQWAATEKMAGVTLFGGNIDLYVREIAGTINKMKRDGDIVILSVHWGENWGYSNSKHQIDFAHAVIDKCGVDCVHGHSSHHVKGIEIYKNKLILYGCGDLINDYEGISGFEEFRGDLSLLYIISFEKNGELAKCKMAPMQMKRFRLNFAGKAGTDWFTYVFKGPAKIHGTDVITCNDGTIELIWNQDQ